MWCQAIGGDPSHADALEAWGRAGYWAIHPFNREGPDVNFMFDAT